MTLFTAEGLIRAHLRFGGRGICHALTVVHRAYLRWLQTQGESPNLEPQFDSDRNVAADGWLINVPALWSRRAPGHTCLSALRNTKVRGVPAKNNSKRCSGVMRAAPVGLVAFREAAFDLGCEIAELTHGHPPGFLSAGFLALVIAEIMVGTSLADSIRAAKATLIKHLNHIGALDAVEKAESFALSEATNPIPKPLGEGWVAKEALA